MAEILRVGLDLEQLRRRWQPAYKLAQGRGDMIINIGNAYPSVSPSPATHARSALAVPAPGGIGRDTLEVSPFGEALARGVEESSLRIARNRAIRAEISSGTYETAERIDRTVERILDVIA